MPKDTILPLDPIVSKVKSQRAKQIVIQATLNDQGTVDYMFNITRETAVITTYQSGQVQVEHKNEEVFTPDWQTIQDFVAPNIPTGVKAVKFWEAFSDAQP